MEKKLEYIRIKRLNQNASYYEFANPGDVGLDVCSMENKEMKPGEHYRFMLGFAMEFKEGFAALMTDKSSISSEGLHILGGVYDAGFRGEYNVHLVNLSKKSYFIEKGDKIAQIIFHNIATPKIIEVEFLSESKRGDGSFGSTGRK
jgi:dUTP pyrophosphatase